MNFLRRKMNKNLGRRGNVAVEFAVFAPFLLILFLGTVEIATAYRTYAKVNAMAFYMANAVSIAQAVSTSDPPIGSQTVTPPYTSFGSVVKPVSLQDLCTGAALGAFPFPVTGMTLDIASITEENAGAYDEWEDDQTYTAGSCAPQGETNILSGAANMADVATAKSMLEVPCDNAIIVQATLKFSGVFGLFFNSSNPLTLSQTAYSRWAIAEAQTELMCAGCSVVGGGTSSLTAANGQTCDSNN